MCIIYQPEIELLGACQEPHLPGKHVLGCPLQQGPESEKTRGKQKCYQII